MLKRRYRNTYRNVTCKKVLKSKVGSEVKDVDKIRSKLAIQVSLSNCFNFLTFSLLTASVSVLGR